MMLHHICYLDQIPVSYHRKQDSVLLFYASKTLNDFGQAPTSCTTPVDLDGTTASWACAASASPAALLGDTGSCAEHTWNWNIFR